MAIIDEMETSKDSTVGLDESKLSDGSLVYCVVIHQEGRCVEIDCINLDAANTLFTLLTNKGSDYII